MSEPTKKVGVLFVCLGNICRSPMAEAVFVHLTQKNEISHLFQVDSAGTCDYHVGCDPDKRSFQCCRNHGVVMKHKARQLCLEDFIRFQYILCMDHSNYADIQELRLQHHYSSGPNENRLAQVHLLGEFDPSASNKIIADPYYGGVDGFEYNFQQCIRSCLGFLSHLGHSKVNHSI